MKLKEGIYLAASGSAGVSLTHDNDCNAYAIDCGGSEFLLIDCGVGIAPQHIVDELEADGVPSSSLRHLLLTHYHLDHCGGARWFRDQFGLQVFASSPTAQALSAGDEAAISLAAAKRAGVYAPDVHFVPCPVDRELKDREVLTVGEVSIEALVTPGHSCDMLSYFVHRKKETHLFCGDTLFFGGKVLLSNVHDCDAPALCRSLRTIAASEFEGFFPGHNLWSLRDGKRHVDVAMTYINRLLIPPSL